MAAFPLTPAQLRFEVERVRRMDSDSLVIGLHAPGPWRGEDEDEVILGDRRYVVVRADSALEFREALAGAGNPTDLTASSASPGALSSSAWSQSRG
jgi:hypothetical protein